MLSPDKQYIWDGHQWLPIAAHRAIFPSWNGISVEGAVAESSAPVQAPVVRPAVSAGVPPAVEPIIEPLDYRARGITPLWERAPAGRQGSALKIAAGLVGIVVVLIFVRQYAWQFLPSSGSGSGSPTASASPTLPPLTMGTDFARADRFYTSVLTPGATALNQAFAQFRETCNGTLSFSCQDATNAELSRVNSLASVVAQAQPFVPQCITPQLTRFQTDLAGTAAALKAVQKAYADNSQPELQQGLARVFPANAALGVDVNVIAQARTACSASSQLGT
jgi:hypothetical protein